MKKALILSTLVVAPMLAFAQELGNVANLLRAVGNLVNIALPIVVALTLLAFFWGLAKFVFAAGNEEAKTEGKKLMIWGIIALFVMVSVWGLVRFIGQALNITDTGGAAPIPSVQFR